MVHVAGTNGKGSVIAFMKAMCEAAGCTAHVYTSPHLVRFNERIAVAGRPIDEATLGDTLEACEAANDGAPITFFEITTAAALLAFSRAPADIALIETGLGGRFDATNVFARPALTAITPVAMDHMHFLGDTLGDIAFEKAGILKPGVTCVVARQPPDAAGVIDARAAATGAPLWRAPADWRVDANRYRDASGRFAMAPPALAGPHQIDNAGHAIACLRALGWPGLDDATIAAGLADVHWPGRLQLLQDGTLVDAMPAGWELWLDGGHNPAASEALAGAVRMWRDAPLHLVLGMLDNRDPAAFLAPLASAVAGVHGVAVPGEPSTLGADDIARKATAIGLDAAPATDVAAAIGSIVGGAGRPGRILICGSLYLAGSVLEANGTPP